MGTKLVDSYTYTVCFSEREQQSVGLCAEFPGLSHFDDSPEAAFAGIRSLIAGILEAMQDEPPAPLPSRIP